MNSIRCSSNGSMRGAGDKALTVLQEQLVPSSVTNEDFLKQCLSGDAVKKLLKACVKAEKNLAKASAIEEDMATRLAAAKSAARAQITMWGVLTIMAEGDLQAQNKKGTDFRAALKEIWGEHKKMLASRLGPEMSKRVTDTIAGARSCNQRTTLSSRARSSRGRVRNARLPRGQPGAAREPDRLPACMARASAASQFRKLVSPAASQWFSCQLDWTPHGCGTSSVDSRS